MKKNLLYAIISFSLSFSIFPLVDAQYTNLYNFSGTPDGGAPLGSLTSDGTFLYGMTQFGGINGIGTIFKIQPDGTGYIKLMDFASSNGSYPTGSLIFDGTFLYGMTGSGGANNMGTIFKILPDGSGYLKLLDFAGSTNGRNPNGDLLINGSSLYGMTVSGGVNDMGTIFKIMTDGSGYVKLLDFSGALNGRGPLGSLISDGTFMYGMTSIGGSNNKGTIFKIMPDGSGYVKLLDFAGSPDGDYPNGSLVFDGTFLYGMTYYGGTSGGGIIFKILTDGSGYTKLLDFQGTTNGGEPYGSLITDGALLFGMTDDGGTILSGTAFKIAQDGTNYVKLIDFMGTTNGLNPHGDLISDGAFLYGMTSSGGSNSWGTIFRYQYAPIGIEENNINASLEIYPNPTRDKINITSENELKNAKLEILNLFGQTVININQINLLPGENYSIDLAFLEPGMYIIRLNNCRKIVIKK